jgi:hypothetical protein
MLPTSILLQYWMLQNLHNCSHYATNQHTLTVLDATEPPQLQSLCYQPAYSYRTGCYRTSTVAVIMLPTSILLQYWMLQNLHSCSHYATHQQWRQRDTLKFCASEKNSCTMVGFFLVSLLSIFCDNPFSAMLTTCFLMIFLLSSLFDPEKVSRYVLTKCWVTLLSNYRRYTQSLLWQPQTQRFHLCY